MLGAIVKTGRSYVHNRTINNAFQKVRRMTIEKTTANENDVAVINSYLGLLKHRTSYGLIRDMVDLVSPRWLSYCHYNDDRRCFEANDGYRHHDILANTYKFRYHDRKRTKRAA